MGCSSADCSSAGSTLTYPDILQHNFTILHSNEVGFFAFKREQNYLQNDTKFIVICFVLPQIFYFKQKINTISVTAPSYLTYLFINCDLLYHLPQTQWEVWDTWTAQQIRMWVRYGQCTVLQLGTTWTKNKWIDDSNVNMASPPPRSKHGGTQVWFW